MIWMRKMQEKRCKPSFEWKTNTFQHMLYISPNLLRLIKTKVLISILYTYRTIDSKTKEITYNPEYYLMKHFSSFISAGAHKIESPVENCLAFKNKDSIVVVY